VLQANRKDGEVFEQSSLDAALRASLIGFVSGPTRAWLRHRRVTRSNLRPWYALSMSEDVLEPMSPLSKALLALPFGLIAAFAWKDWVLWPAIVLGVMIVFAFRRNARTVRYAAYSSIYAAVLVFAIPPWQGFWFLERLQMFFVVLALLHLVGLAFEGARDGSFWAWLAPLIVFVLQPSALGLVAVLALGLLGALEQRQKRLGQWAQSRTGMVVLAVFAGLVLVLSLPLPKVGSFPVASTSGTPLKAEAVKPESESRAATVSTASKDQDSSSPMLPDILAVFNRSFMVIQVAMLTVLVCVIIIVLRFQSRDRAKSSRWEDLLPLFAAAILGLAILIYGVSAPSGGAASESGQNQSGNGLSRQVNSSDSGKSSVPSALNTDNSWPTVIFALVSAAAIAWVMLRSSRLFVEKEATFASLESSLEPEEATNRVREAYRAFLNLCARNGLNRLESETPLEFAQRLSETHPVAVQHATDLTALYEPVRYGGLSDLIGARAAEQALFTLRELLKPSTNPKDGTHD
jgi:Domain of unknown function (DUF4129)